MYKCFAVIELPGGIDDIKHNANVSFSSACPDYMDEMVEDLKRRFKVLDCQVLS